MMPTHSFYNQSVKEYIGKFDTSDEEMELIHTTLTKPKKIFTMS